MGLEGLIWGPCWGWGAVGRGWHPAGLPRGSSVTWVGSSRGFVRRQAVTLRPRFPAARPD